MKYICAQPGTRYYAWQLEVMLMNFTEMEVPLEDVHILLTMPNNEDASAFGNLFAAYPKVTFAIYPDTRRTTFYPSSIRPNILKQHFFQHKNIDSFLYHDCDIVFTNKLNFKWFLGDEDDNCYGSDTRFYIGHDYIKGKGYNILEQMADIVGIDVETIKQNELNCIGAQYLLKGVDYMFWSEVERTSEMLFHQITMRNAEIKMKDPRYHELQIWTADMWAVLWQLWKQGKKTKVHDYFDFAWATSTIQDWNRLNIFHNAGITETGHGFFYKGDYIQRTPDKNLNIRENSAQKHYYEYVKKLQHTI